MKTPSRLAAPLLAVLALVALTIPPASAVSAPKLAPVLTITAGDPNTPVRVPLPTEDPSSVTIGYHVEVSGGPATNVTVSASGTGLTTSAPKNLGNVSTSAYGDAEVTAATGGFHQLTFTVTADGAAPAMATLSYVWAPTGALTVSPGADLQYTYFGTTGTYSEADTSYEDRAMLLFLSDHVAYYGVPHGGLPRCKTGSTTATSGCLEYAYDPTTHLIQVGGAIGTVDKFGVHTIGLGITDYQGGEYYPHRDWLDRLSFPNTHNRYAGTWQYGKSTFLYTFFVSLTLRKNGTFSLTQRFDKKKRVLTGRYDVSHFGRMVLTGKFGRQVDTFAVLLDKKGKPDPRRGVALGSGKKNDTDVYFLVPPKKK